MQTIAVRGLKVISNLISDSRWDTYWPPVPLYKTFRFLPADPLHLKHISFRRVT